MVRPIDYTMDVLNPIEGMLRGYSLGRQDIEQRQVMQEREQVMGIRGQQEARAQQQFEAQQAAAARQRAQAAAMQEQLMGLREMALEGTLTSEALDQFALANASTFDEFRSAFQNLSEPRRQETTQFNLQLNSSLFRGNTDVAMNMLDTRIAAAENAGTPEAMREAAALRAVRGEIEIDPFDFAVANLTNMVAQGAIDSTTARTFLDSVGDFKVKSSELIGGIASVQISEDGKTRIVDTRTNTAVTGPAAASLIKEAEEVSEEPLSPMGKLVFDLNAGNITPEQFKSASEKGPLVQNIVGEGETEFAKTAGKTQATQYANLTEAGFSASRNLRELNTLEDVLKNIDTGGGAAVKAYLGRYGIATEGLDLIQAAEAAINRLVPAQRPPGSGTMSDADLALFKRSLPSLINQPGGNQTIIDTIRAINEYDVAASVIAGRALDGELKPSEARAAIRDLPNPLADFKAQAGAPAQAEGGDVKAAFLADPRIKKLSPEQQEIAWEVYQRQVNK